MIMIQYRTLICLDTFALRHDITGHVLENATWCDEAVILEGDTMKQYAGHKNTLYGMRKGVTEYLSFISMKLQKRT
jgi:hypothetical protein